MFKFMQHKEYVSDFNGDFNITLFLRNTRFSEGIIKEVAQILKESEVAPLMVG